MPLAEHHHAAVQLREQHFVGRLIGPFALGATPEHRVRHRLGVLVGGRERLRHRLVADVLVDLLYPRRVDDLGLAGPLRAIADAL
jgi:hypothetical protein